MSKGIGPLQRALVVNAIKYNRITLKDARKLYFTESTARIALRQLEVRNYLNPSGMGEWKPTKKAEEEMKNEIE